MIKSECRKIFSEKRKQLSDDQLTTGSNKILNRLIDTIDLKNKTVSIFLPIKFKQEIDTYPLIELKDHLSIRFVLPVADFETNEMQHYLYEDSSKIRVSEYGIPEPVNGIIVEANEIDIVIIPLLCFDKKGYRVGYGKGFYDRFLTSCRKDCQFIGLSFFEPIPEISDVFENDVRMHKCITQNQIHYF